MPKYKGWVLTLHLKTVHVGVILWFPSESGLQRRYERLSTLSSGPGFMSKSQDRNWTFYYHATNEKSNIIFPFPAFRVSHRRLFIQEVTIAGVCSDPTQVVIATPSKRPGFVFSPAA